MSKLSEVIRQQRLKLHLRQDQIPPFTRQEISQYERGVRRVPRHRIADLAAGLQLDLDYLLSLSDTRDLGQAKMQGRGAQMRRHIQSLLDQNRRLEAHALAAQWSRKAEASETDSTVYAAANLLNEILAQISPDELIPAILAHVTRPETVEEFAGLAWSRESYDLARTATRYAQSLYVPASSDYAKHQRNYTRILARQGFIQDAYDAMRTAIALSEPHLSHDRVVALQAEYDYLGVYLGLAPQFAPETVRLAAHNPFTWYMHWRAQLLWHWRNQDWPSLSHALMTATEQMHAQKWPGTHALALSSAKARLAWATRHDTALYDQLLRQIAHHPTQDVAMWEDQAHDAWWLARDMNRADDASRQGAMLLIKMYLQKRLGWAAYYYDPHADYAWLPSFAQGLVTMAVHEITVRSSAGAPLARSSRLL